MSNWKQAEEHLCGYPEVMLSKGILPPLHSKEIPVGHKYMPGQTEG